MNLYTPERQQEIIKKFKNLLMEADNFSRTRRPDDYRDFWIGLRGEGSSMLGLTQHLLDSLSNAKKVIEKLENKK